MHPTGYENLIRALAFGNRESRLRGSKKLDYLAMYDSIPLGDIMWQSRNELITELKHGARQRIIRETTIPLVLRLFDRLCEEAGNPHPRHCYIGADVELAMELGISRERVRQLHDILFFVDKKRWPERMRESVRNLRVILENRLRERKVRTGEKEAYELFETA